MVEAVHPKTEVNPGLDAVELPAARWAVGSNVPVLGICRGQQLLNVALGGSLVQHVDDHRQKTSRREVSHTLHVQPDSRLAGLWAATRSRSTASTTRPSIASARVCRAVAWSPDGVIEGLESTDHPWLVCVQYHPEDLIDAHAPSQRLLEGFVAACRERSAVSALVAS